MPDFPAPFPNVAHAVLAKVENDVAIELLEFSPHLLIRLFQMVNGFATGFAIVTAPVVFQEIKAPRGKGARVLRLVLPASRETRARRRARVKCKCPP